MTPVQPTLSTRAQEVLEKVQALRRHTTLTRFRTTRAQNELLSTLNGEDLATVVQALDKQ